MITVRTSDGGFEVVVREGSGSTLHRVTVSDADLARLAAPPRTAEALVEAAFRFLLERELKEAILPRFDLSVIQRYFPEFERELPRYFGAGPRQTPTRS